MKKMVLTLGIALGLLAPGAALATVPVPTYASAFNSTNAAKQVCSGINGSEKSGNCSAPGRSITSIIRTILNLLSALIGIVAVVMIMVSGFKFITAAGDAGKVAGARSTLIYALVGLVIVAMAQFITQFVMKKVT